MKSSHHGRQQCAEHKRAQDQCTLDLHSNGVQKVPLCNCALDQCTIDTCLNKSSARSKWKYSNSELKWILVKRDALLGNIIPRFQALHILKPAKAKFSKLSLIKSNLLYSLLKYSQIKYMFCMMLP